MEIKQIDSNNNLSEVVQVLNTSHGTVAKEFNFTKENNPSNSAFIDEATLRTQLNSGVELYVMSIDSKLVGCIAIEKSKRQEDTFYIEKVSVIPELREQGIGIILMEFAIAKIKEQEGEIVSIALIDSHVKLKSWYASQGFIETGVKDFKYLPFRVCFMSKQL